MDLNNMDQNSDDLSVFEVTQKDQREIEERLADNQAHRKFKHLTFFGSLFLTSFLFVIAYFWLYTDKTQDPYTHLVPFVTSLSAGLILASALIKAVFFSQNTKKTQESELDLVEIIKKIIKKDV